MTQEKSVFLNRMKVAFRDMEAKSSRFKSENTVIPGAISHDLRIVDIVLVLV